MSNRKISKFAIMEAVVIHFAIFACLLVNVQTSNDPDVSQLAKIAEESFSNTSVNVCDETNANNSYVYKLLILTLLMFYSLFPYFY